MNIPSSIPSAPPAPSAPRPAQPTSTNSLVARFVPLICIGVAVFSAVYFIFWPEYQRDTLIKNGIPATAVILNADPTGSTYNSQPEVRLRLRVTPSDGVAYEAETEMVINPIYAPQFQPGKSVKVKYDKEDRSKVAVEETENGQR